MKFICCPWITVVNELKKMSVVARMKFYFPLSFCFHVLLNMNISKCFHLTIFKTVWQQRSSRVLKQRERMLNELTVTWKVISDQTYQEHSGQMFVEKHGCLHHSAWHKMMMILLLYMIIRCNFKLSPGNKTQHSAWSELPALSMVLSCLFVPLSTVQPVEEQFCSLFWFRRGCEVLWGAVVYVQVPGVSLCCCKVTLMLIHQLFSSPHAL